MPKISCQTTVQAMNPEHVGGANKGAGESSGRAWWCACKDVSNALVEDLKDLSRLFLPEYVKKALEIAESSLWG